MTVSKALIRSAVGAALILALIGGSPLFAGETIHNGVDLWMTVSGFAQTSFANDPLPAGFFCEASQPFIGVVKFKGAPLAVEPAGSLGTIDTVVRRLDDAKFDAKGEAVTRIQLMALSLVSTKPIETSCGKYDVAVSLTGKQPVTTMKIFQTDAFGGTYTAPLALNVKAVFTPVNGDKSGRREVARRIDLGPGSHSVWAYVNLPRYKQGVRVDTNGDGKPDMVLPASSNFLAGVSPALLKSPPPLPRLAASISGGGTGGTGGGGTGGGSGVSCPAGQCPYQSCHCADLSSNPQWNQSATGCTDDHLHCIWTCAPSGATAPNGLAIACETAQPLNPGLQ
ncbi:MAG TPA: hypothetical protein VLX28_08445 [Thermoanaerobaculia bacterium]|nr:hypothetical protein [Thermoanaerobaculia bacterium]